MPGGDADAAAHPAPFPLDLPLRLILLYTNIGDIVLDPFLGSGQVAVVSTTRLPKSRVSEVIRDWIFPEENWS